MNKKTLIITILLLIFTKNIYAVNMFDNIFDDNKKIELNLEVENNNEDSKNSDNSFSKNLLEDNIEVDLRESKAFKSDKERKISINTHPDDFYEKYQENYGEWEGQKLPEWIKTRKSNKQELNILCTMKNGDFKIINTLNENWFISPEYDPEDNYYTYFWSRTRYVYVWNWSYEQVKECDFSPLYN